MEPVRSKPELAEMKKMSTPMKFENVDSGRSHSQSDLARNALPIK
jgi:hypothetical protein